MPGAPSFFRVLCERGRGFLGYSNGNSTNAKIPSMKPHRFLLPYLLLAALAVAQTTTPAAVPITAEPSHHLILENEYVRVFRVEVPPHAQTLIHRHDHDYIFVTLGDSEVENTVTAKPPVQLKLKDGDTRFLMGGFSHTAHNLSDQPFRNITIELLNDNTHAPAVEFVTPVSPAQKILFTQDGVRVSEIRLAPGAALPRHEHKAPHLVVAVTDLNLHSDAAGKPPAELHQKSGDIKWVPGGFTHTLTNTGTSEARFVTHEF